MKNPRGCVDLFKSNIQKMDLIKNIIEESFSQHNAEKLETPILELEETLSKKYGEDEKLIFKCSENTGLRFDQTIPLTRFVLSNKLEKNIIYQINKVYRRDTNNVANGRYCEFYQADIDFIGNYPVMESEIKIVKIIDNVFKKLKSLSTFDKKVVLRYNFRNNLINTIKLVGLDFSNELCSSIDKLDKFEKSIIIDELAKSYDKSKLEQLFELIGSNYVHESILNDKLLFENYLSFYNLDINVCFDSSLVRGLDYYTGIIFEIQIGDFKSSCGGGGRYDNLLNKMSSGRITKNMIGFSFGLSRICHNFELIKDEKQNNTIYIANLKTKNKDMKLKLSLFDKLIENGFKVDFTFQTKIVGKHLMYCDEQKYKYMVVIGDTEIETNTFTLCICNGDSTIKNEEFHNLTFEELYNLIKN